MLNLSSILTAGVRSGYAGLTAVLLSLVLIFSFATQHFFTYITFKTIANQIPVAILISVGMTYVLIAGGIDLSVGAVLALSGSVFGVCLVQFEWPLLAAAAACLMTGLCCGALNGWVSVRWKIPSFIVTLGMMEIARGGAYLITRSQTQYLGARVEPISDASVMGLSASFLAAIAVAGLAQVVLARTLLGRYLVAIGTNEEVVRLSGINPRMPKVLVFMLSGMLAACGSIIHCARLASADPNAGAGFELQAIAAVVIGGTSLMGGEGSVLSSVFGVLIIAVLDAGLAQAGVPEPLKRVITGAVIIIAVIADRYRHKQAR